MKYDWKFKLDCVLKYKEGRRDFAPRGLKSRSFFTHVKSWIKAYDALGIDGLKHKKKSKKWTKEQRFELVSKVLAGNSILSVAEEAHINDGQLHRWLNRYREKGLEGLELRKGKPPNKFMSLKKLKLKPTEKEELKLLKERNKYLEAENLYLKKLRALELEKTAKLAKAKKQESSKPSKKNSNAA